MWMAMMDRGSTGREWGRGGVWIWVLVMVLMTLADGVWSHHYLGCPVRPKRIRPCEQPDEFYLEGRCALPKLMDVVDYQAACEDVYNFIRYATPCNLNPKAHDLTAVVMRKGCRMKSGHFVILSTTLKGMLNVVERRCRRTNRIFDERHQEPGFFDSTLHPKCSSDIAGDRRMIETDTIVRAELDRAPSSVSLPSSDRQLGCNTTPCISSYNCLNTCAQQIDGNTYCCPANCANVLPLFVKICCIWQNSMVACQCTLPAHLSVGFC